MITVSDVSSCDQPAFVWTVIASMVVGNAILLILNLPLIRVWVMLLRVPYAVLFAVILEFTVIGAYAVSNSGFDVIVMTVAGFLGYLLKKLDFPLAPLVLTLVLGPLLEQNLRRSLQMSNGSFRILIDSPIALTVLCVAAIALFWPAIRIGLSALRRRSSSALPRSAA